MPSAWETGDPEERPSDPRYYTIMEGTVIDNQDPKGLGRVRFTVPGVVDPPGSAWAFPAGMGGGAAQRGMFRVPEVGAGVYVFFLKGDVDKPRYFTGHYGMPDGESEAPTDVNEAFNQDGKEAPPQIQAWETEKFAVVIDNREDRSRLYLYATQRDGAQNYDDATALGIELDNETGQLILSAPGGVIIRTQGIFDVQSLTAQINDRKVWPVNKPI